MEKRLSGTGRFPACGGSHDVVQGMENPRHLAQDYKTPRFNLTTVVHLTPTGLWGGGGSRDPSGLSPVLLSQFTSTPLTLTQKD